MKSRGAGHISDPSAEGDGDEADRVRFAGVVLTLGVDKELFGDCCAKSGRKLVSGYEVIVVLVENGATAFNLDV